MVVGRTAALMVLALLLAPLRVFAILFVPLTLFMRPRRRYGDPPPLRIPPDLDRTAPPELHADGTAACSGCNAVVPFASMSICEDGYFCPGCARAA